MMHYRSTADLLAAISRRIVQLAWRLKGKKKGMHLSEESHNQGTEQSVLVKKPTKWMTNCPALAATLWVRCI